MTDDEMAMCTAYIPLLLAVLLGFSSVSTSLSTSSIMHGKTILVSDK